MEEWMSFCKIPPERWKRTHQENLGVFESNRHAMARPRPIQIAWPGSRHGHSNSSNQGLVDFPALQRLVELQHEQGCGFLVILGTTGKPRRSVPTNVVVWWISCWRLMRDVFPLLWGSQATTPVSCVRAHRHMV